MKRILLASILITTIVCCKKSPGKLIAGRWDFTVAVPVYHDSVDLSLGETSAAEEEQNVPDFSERSLAANKFILRSNGSFDLCLMQAYMHGTWRFDVKEKLLRISDESNKDSFTIKVDSAGPRYLELSTDSFFIKKIIALSHTKNTAGSSVDSILSCKFYLLKSSERYSNLEKDPYSIVYNQWRIKPGQKENALQLKQRVLNHLQFLQMLFKDAGEKQRDQVTYNWFNTPLIIAGNGIALKFFNEIKTDWSKNFYDSVQAMQGYQELRKSFKKKIKYLETDNIFEKKVDMFRQMIKNVEQH